MRGTRTGQGLVTQLIPRPIAYTPAVVWGGNTVASPTGFYLKEPGKLTIWVSFVESAGVASASLTISTPTGYSAAQTQNVGTIVGLTANNGPIGVTAGAFSQLASLLNLTGVVTTWSGVFTIPTTT